ncbi:SMC family ATPase [Priestia megaterium]
MRIEKLKIHNFRIFNGTYDFDFREKDLIIVNGPNGFGKSTIFDAIQWCITGSIQRYKGSHEYQNFNYVFNESLLNNEENLKSLEVSVEVLLNNKGRRNKIKRVLTRNSGQEETKILINDQRYRVKKGNEKIKDLLIKQEVRDFLFNQENGDRFDLATFFSATQLLCQDALQDFIQAKNPAERFLILEKVLGLQRYGEEFKSYLDNWVKKIQERKNLITERLNNIEKEVIEVSTILYEKEELYKKINGETLNEIHEKVKEYTDYIQDEFGIKIENLEVYKDENLLSKNMIKVLKASIRTYKDELDIMIQDIVNSRKYFLSPLDKLYKQKRLLKNEIYKIKIKIQNRTDGISRAEKKNNNLKSLLLNQEVYKQTLNSLKILNDEINKLAVKEEKVKANDQLVNVQSQYKNLEEFMYKYEDFEKRISEYEQISLFNNKQLRVNDLNKEIQTILTKETTIQNNIENNRINYKKLTREIQTLERELNKREREGISQIIHDIQNHLLDHSNSETCLVCGTNFETLENLQSAIKKRMENTKAVLNLIEKSYLELVTKRNSIEREKESLDRELHLIDIKKKELNQELTSLKLELEKFQLDKLRMSLEEIEERTTRTRDFLGDNKITYELAKYLEQLKITKIEKETEVKKLIQKMNDLKSVSGNLAIYLENDSIIIDEKIQNLERYILKAKATREKLIQLKGKEDEKLREIEVKELDREQAFKRISNILPNFQGDVQELKSSLDLFMSKKDRLNYTDSELNILAEKMEAYSSESNIQLLKNKEKKLAKISNLERRKINKINTVTSQLNSIISEHQTVRSKIMLDYLSKYNEIIDYLFVQISPHGFYKHVHLIPNKRNLYILLSKEAQKKDEIMSMSEDNLNRSFNASLTLSSGQTNVLAICIFLALSITQNWTSFNFIGIDDPFQNLDDINVYSFVDIINQLLSEKQIIISTHSDDFVALVTNKVDLDNHNIGYIKLDGYGPNDVKVKGNCIGLETY